MNRSVKSRVQLAGRHCSITAPFGFANNSPAVKRLNGAVAHVCEIGCDITAIICTCVIHLPIVLRPERAGVPLSVLAMVAATSVIHTNLNALPACQFPVTCKEGLGALMILLNVARCFCACTVVHEIGVDEISLILQAPMRFS